MKRDFCLFLCLIFVSLAIACQSTSNVVSNDGKVDVVGNNWVIKFPTATPDSSSPKNIELRFLKDTNHPTIANDVSADATSMELSNVDGFPAAGKIYTFNGETIGYDSISGNTLKDLKRGIDGSTAQNQTKGQAAYLITMQREVGDKTEYQTPQLPDSYYIHYRRQTDSKDNGNNGWSGFGMVGFAPGSAASATAK